MTDEDKTKEQLITELGELRKRIAEIEKSETQRNQTEEALREAEARYRGMKEPSEAAKPEIFRQHGDPGVSSEKPHNRFITGDIYIRTALVCSAITLILGTLVMTGWVTGMYYLASLGLSSIPMAPGTSLAFILLGGTWFFYLRAPSRRLTRVSVLASVLFVLLLALLNLIQFFTGVNTGIEEFLVRRVLALGPDIYGAGPMSPLTAFNFVLACTAMILLLKPTTWCGGVIRRLCLCCNLGESGSSAWVFIWHTDALWRGDKTSGAPYGNNVFVSEHGTYRHHRSRSLSPEIAGWAIGACAFTSLFSSGDICLCSDSCCY